jgi:cytochrome c-type biogenesis protein CcmH/NrfF
VDALGGGYLRSPISTEAIPYNGDLKDFGEYFDLWQKYHESTLLLYVFGGSIVVLVSITIYLAVEIRKLKASHKHTLEDEQEK